MTSLICKYITMSLTAFSLVASLMLPSEAESFSIWNTSTVPSAAAVSDGQPIEVGVKFRSDVSGSITGLRFYKGASNTGTHVGHLWSRNGTLLATATFTGESASGWQEVSFQAPVAINANTTYVASYYSASGYFAVDHAYFASAGVDTPPLHALANGVDGGNGVYRYGTSGFPTQSFNSNNYWVDVVFSATDPPPVTLSSISVTPGNQTIPPGETQQFTATGIYSDSSTQNITGQATWASSNTGAATISGTALATAINPGMTTISATLSGVTGSTSLTVAVGSAAPILIITSASNPFTGYYAEILRAEGFNAFDVKDISSVSSSILAPYDVVLLGEMPLTASQVTMLSNWVNAGGNLIAMRPDKNLANLLGLTDVSSTRSNAYLLVDTSTGPGFGIVNESIQFHGTADQYTLNGASSIATLYSNATTRTSNPAVTLNNVGTSGGKAAAFAYDLARSVVYTRQGNPAWSGQERDGFPPIRSDDLFYGAASFDPRPNWIDLSKVAIPQADEQQRLLANLIIQMNSGKKPLPRFWYLPRSLPAAVVMTGDDHDGGGTAGRFDSYLSASPQGCSVENWECIRSTSYVYPTSPLSNSLASVYHGEGFEVALHVNTDCADWTPFSLESFVSDQLATWNGKYSAIPRPVTNRVHCVVWSDYSTLPTVELNHGIRLDSTYYYWPPEWVANRPGFFTGSGMPMRFGDSSGNIIDVYQAVTQMTDESGQSYPVTIDTLLDRAIGPEGYYGVFAANIHTDVASSGESNAIIQSAKARGIPVISARQMLEWLDGRNSSAFSALVWNGNSLNFSISTAQGANGLSAMVPVLNGQSVSGVTRNGSSIAFTPTVIKGIQYVRFQAASGVYQVNFDLDATPPAVSGVSPADGTSGVNPMANVSATFSEAVDPATVNTGTFILRDPANVPVTATVAYNAATQTATLVPVGPLQNSLSYTATVRGGANGVKDLTGNPLSSDVVWGFTTAAASTGSYSIWPGTAIPASAAVSDGQPIEVGVKFRSDTSGLITGLRFYKGANNAGTHVGHLWSRSGTLLATATFTGESASGWQEVSFPAPVAIAANTTYVASYYSSSGYFAVDHAYFASAGVDAPPLHALANGADGGNGVYRYGTSGFPAQSFNANNYWVDVVFSAAGSTDSVRPTVTGFTVPATATSLTVPINSFTATDNVGVTGYLVNESATTPSASAGGWSATAPTFYTFATAGDKTLYAWARDAAGNVSASASASVTITLQVTGPEPAGWYAGDMHVHRSNGGAPISIATMYQLMIPQNLSVISLLADMGNGEVQNPVTDLPLVNGQDDPVSTPGRIVHWDAEWHWDATYSQYAHQALGGHVVALGLTEAHQIWEEYTYPIFNWARQQGAIAGFAHMEYLDDSIPQSLTCCTPLEYPVEVALGAADFISEDVTDGTYEGTGLYPENTIRAYYRLLNCGFRPGLAAGTDYPFNGGPTLGSLLTYVQVPTGQLTYRGWIEGIARGRTVVSRNGHNEFLDLKVNNSLTPGDEIKLTGGGSVQVTIQWTAAQNLSGTIELVRNGEVVASRQASVAPGASANLSATVNFTKSGWLAARRMSSNGHQVHTAAVFVTVDNAPVRASAADAQYYVQWMDNLLEKTSPGGAWNSFFVNSRSAAQARYQSAKSMYQQIASEAAATLNITTSSLPAGTLDLAYSTTLGASGGTPPYTWSLVSGSLPAGLSLNSATGTISGTPTSAGSFSFTVQVSDSGTPGQSATQTVNIAIVAAVSSTIWPATTFPASTAVSDGQPITVGVKFRSDVNGYITGLRFYKGTSNTGTHVGSLWTRNGTLLGSATFTNETASGWQQVNFPTPIAVTANTTYVASYYSPSGYFAVDLAYFSTKGVDSPPLHALANGVDGGNGVYKYGTSGFPNLTFNGNNYWVDVVFTP